MIMGRTAAEAMAELKRSGFAITPLPEEDRKALERLGYDTPLLAQDGFIS
jgi:hypothetical protein